jgi:uncharacterized protein involved in exopolysaccharide biosynthesis
VYPSIGDPPPIRHLQVQPDEEASVMPIVLAWVRAGMRHRRLVIAVSLISAVVFVVPSFLFSRSYTAASSFMVESPNNSAQRFLGMAAQLGIALPSGTSDALETYTALAQSRVILQDVARKRYRLVRRGLFGDTRVGTYAEVNRIEEPDSVKRMQTALRLLHSHMGVGSDPKSRMIFISTSAPSAEMAETLNQNILTSIAQFDLQKRQTRAGAEKAFLGARLSEAQADLRAAEDALRNFMTANRGMQSSPQLQTERARLDRQVSFLQQVQQNLAQSYEQARIEQVRNTPVITVVDSPAGSAVLVRTRKELALMGLAIGFVLALLIAVVLERRAEGRDSVLA